MAETTSHLEPGWLDPAALIELLDELQEAGYDLELNHYIAAQDLLLALVAQGESLDQPHRLRGLLGPLLCSSPAEQADFQQRFDRWLTQWASSTHPAQWIERQPNDLEAELITLERQMHWGRWALLACYIFLVSILLPASHPPLSDHSLPVTPTPATVQEEPVAPNLTPPTPSTNARWRWEILVWAFLLPLPWLAWRLWWFYRAHLFLMRHATTETPQLEQVVIRGNLALLFPPQDVLRLAQGLRRRSELAGNELDVEAALNATLQAGGWFTPVYGRRRLIPEYLILVDRAHYHDHGARLVEALIHQLAAHEVLLTGYAFDGDPRVCFPLTGQGRPLTLRELTARHPDQRLLLFADASAFFNPFSGALEPWIERMMRWPLRVLMTPEAPANWGYREQVLAQHFRLLPATPAGLNQLVRSLTQAAPWIVAEDGARARLPNTLRTRPRRWLEPQPPDPEQVAALLFDLHCYLDEAGFLWLCACAVYPALDWNLTLYLGDAVQTDDERPLADPVRLLTLARLPWLRYSYMPDWLRSRLLASLSRAQEQAIRFALHRLLISSVQGTPDAFSLNFARRHWRGLQALAKPLLRLLIHKADAASPLRDYVFVQFMLGHSSLAFQVPSLLADLLGKHERAGSISTKPLWRRLVGINDSLFLRSIVELILELTFQHILSAVTPYLEKILDLRIFVKASLFALLVVVSFVLFATRPVSSVIANTPYLSNWPRTTWLLYALLTAIVSNAATNLLLPSRDSYRFRFSHQVMVAVIAIAALAALGGYVPNPLQTIFPINLEYSWPFIIAGSFCITGYLLINLLGARIGNQPTQEEEQYQLRQLWLARPFAPFWLHSLTATKQALIVSQPSLFHNNVQNISYTNISNIRVTGYFLPICKVEINSLIGDIHVVIDKMPRRKAEQFAEIVMARVNFVSGASPNEALTHTYIENLSIQVPFNLYELDRITESIKKQIDESSIAQKDDFALGLFYLDHAQYPRAIKAFAEAHDVNPYSGKPLYYLTVARSGAWRERPSGINRQSVRQMEKDLALATEMQDSQAHYWYLWALIKHEYYGRNHLRMDAPLVDELLTRGNELFAASTNKEALIGEIRQMQRHVKDSAGFIDSQIYSSIRFMESAREQQAVLNESERNSTSPNNEAVGQLRLRQRWIAMLFTPFRLVSLIATDKSVIVVRPELFRVSRQEISYIHIARVSITGWRFFVCTVHIELLRGDSIEINLMPRKRAEIFARAVVKRVDFVTRATASARVRRAALNESERDPAYPRFC